MLNEKSLEENVVQLVAHGFVVVLEQPNLLYYYQELVERQKMVA